MAGRVEIPLVGRAHELETLADLLGRGGVALLAGEPGVGKTRLARSFAELAERRGSITLWGSAYDEWSAPYGPWTQALAPYLRTLVPERLAADAAVLAAVVPEVGAIEAAPALGSRGEEFRLHDAVARVLAAADRAVTVVLDDFHWADRASLDLLLAVARARANGVLLVATVRDGELADPVMRCIAELTRERLVQRIDVQPLTAAESAALLELFDVDTSVAAAIYERALGNPFFTEELARDVRERGTQTLAIPESVRMTVRSRVGRLSAEGSRLLGLASVFTRPFSFAALQALAERPEETLLDAVDEALAAGLLRVARPEDESYDFPHALVRESLLEELNPSRRARLHRRVAQALEALDGGPDTAAEIAAQYHRSASLPGAAHGVGFALTAAADAELRYARSEVAHLLRIARDLSAELEPRSRAEILCRLALAEADALQLDEARDTATTAQAALAGANAADEATIDFVWSLARVLMEAGAPEEHVRPFVERGLDLVGPTRDLRWARLQLVLRPAEPISAGRIPAERWLGYDPEAVRIARSSGSEHDYASTLELMDWRSREEVDALLARARGWREAAPRIHALSIAARTLLYNLGAFRDAYEISRELLAESERVGSLAGTAYALEQLADVEIGFGDFDAARAHLDQARATARSLGPAHRLHFIIDLVEQRLVVFVGADWDRLAAGFERAATDARTPWPWITMQAAGWAAMAHAHADRRERATRLLDELLPFLESQAPTTLNHNSTVGHGGEAVWRLEDAERAEPFRRLALALVEAGVGDHVQASNELTIARLSALLDELEDAQTWFARARDKLAADGRRPLHAIAVVDEAAIALRAGLSVPRADLREAAELFSSRGMVSRADRADALLSEAEAAPPAGLTSREVEVLRLLAEGRTNREIAATLVLSVHTVERHLANTYRKIGARNRSDATAFALRNL
jgi:DNA-binding CsgD family transcriptional regulator